MIRNKKFFFYLLLAIFYFFILTAGVFAFSFISLVNGKTYDLFWIKSIQKKVYSRGYRNIWQHDRDCISFDKNLLYKPKIGSCNFSNPEFSTQLNFDEFSRKHISNNQITDLKDYILVLGDSVAMGWGVNDEETFSYLLEKLHNKKVYNLAVSSYGTIREIKRMKLSSMYENSKTIIIQYHSNDLLENRYSNFDKKYTKDDYLKIFDDDISKLDSLWFILRNYKTSIRLFFSDLFNLISKKNSSNTLDFTEHKKYLENVIRSSIDLEEKKVIVFLPIEAFQRIKNFPKSNDEIKYVLIKLDKSDLFVIDDHPNKKGHLKIANVLFNILQK